jgi:hypothetical protein
MCVDTPTAPHKLAGTEYTFYMNPHMASSYTDALVLRVADAWLSQLRPPRPWHWPEFMTGTDTWLAEPAVGSPTVWPYSGTGVHSHHNSESRRLPHSSLANVFAAPAFGMGHAVLVNADVLHGQQDRLVGKEQEMHELIGKLLRDSGIKPEFAVTDQSGNAVAGVETHRFRDGGVTIIGLLRNPSLRVNELGPPEFKSNGRFEKPISVRLTPPAELYAWNIRTGESLDRQKQITVALDPFEAAIFAFSPTPIPELLVSSPARVAPASTGRTGLSFASTTSAAAHVLHVEAIDPSGKVVPYYAGNLLAPEGNAVKSLPLALNDARGRWQLRVRDVLTGQSRRVNFEKH